MFFIWHFFSDAAGNKEIRVIRKLLKRAKMHAGANQILTELLIELENPKYLKKTLSKHLKLDS